jgi:hypothetical protein
LSGTLVRSVPSLSLLAHFFHRSLMALALSSIVLSEN